MMGRSRHARGISFFIRMNNFRFLYFLDKVFYIFEMKKYICRVVEFFFGGVVFSRIKKERKTSRVVDALWDRHARAKME